MWFNVVAVCVFTALALCALSDRLQGMIALLLYRLSQLALLGVVALGAVTFFRPDRSPKWLEFWRSSLASKLPLNSFSDREETLMVFCAAGLAGLVLIILARFLRDATLISAELSSIRKLSGRLMGSDQHAPVGLHAKKHAAEFFKEFFRGTR